MADSCTGGSCNNPSNTTNNSNAGNSGPQNSNNKTTSISDLVLNVQAQVASQTAHVSQSGIAASGDASSTGGTAVAGNGGNGGDAKATVDNSSSAKGGSADTCKVADCTAKANGGSATSSNGGNTVTGGSSTADGGITGDAKADLAKIVRMMIGLLKRFSERADVLKEEDGHYRYQRDQEHDQDQEQERKP